MRGKVAPAVTLILLLLAGCSPDDHSQRSAAGAAAYGGRFVYPMRFEPQTLDFAASHDQSGALILRLVADSLVDHDEALQIVPRLADSWRFSDDGRVLTFHLRPGVRFHDGKPLTSADVAFTYERIVDPATRALAWIDAFLPIVRLETPDALTVRVVYREPHAAALRGWEVPILPRHLYLGRETPPSKLNRAPVGSGPFRFVSWEAGRRLVLEANTDYWAGRPYLDRLVFEIIPSQETTLQALLAGEIDYALLTPVQWNSHGGRAALERRFRTISFVPLFLYYIAWRGDGSNPFFADPRVRRAMTMALDRGGYVRSVLHGMGEIADSPFHPLVRGAVPMLPVTPFDPPAAARELAAAGWRLDPRTGLRAREGRPFRFRLLVFSGGEEHMRFSQVAQESLRRLGIGMAIEPADWSTLSSRLQSGAFEAALSGTVPGLDPDSFYAMLHSSQIAAGQNYAAFTDRQVDGWLDAARSTLDAARRAALYHDVDARLRDLQPYSFLFFPVVQAALSRRILDVRPSPLGILGYYPGAASFRTAPEGAP